MRTPAGTFGKKWKWVPQRALAEIIFLSVREVLAPVKGHPDSKRQARRKARDLTRYGARTLKATGEIYIPSPRPKKKRELKAMQHRMREEQEKFARECAARLLGMRNRDADRPFSAEEILRARRTHAAA